MHNVGRSPVLGENKLLEFFGLAVVATSAKVGWGKWGDENGGIPGRSGMTKMGRLTHKDNGKSRTDCYKPGTNASHGDSTMELWPQAALSKRC